MFIPPRSSAKTEAFRVFRTWNHERRFSHIVLLVGACGNEVSYRFPGGSVVHTMTATEWDALDLEPSDQRWSFAGGRTG